MQSRIHDYVLGKRTFEKVKLEGSSIWTIALPKGSY